MGALAGTLAVRVAIHALVGEPSPVLLIGDGVKARAVMKAIEEGGEGSYRVVAMVDPRREGVGPLEEMADAPEGRVRGAGRG